MEDLARRQPGESGMAGVKRKRASKKGSQDVQREYAIGIQLIHFMMERNIIHLSKDVGLSTDAVVIRKGEGYIPQTLYVVCNFDLSLIPIKLNLPMVCRPINWSPVNTEHAPETLSDLRGGYLCKPSASVYNQFRILTSHDIEHFYIKRNPSQYLRLCDVLNGLQSQAFEINQSFLQFLEKNHDYLVDSG